MGEQLVKDKKVKLFITLELVELQGLQNSLR